MREELDQRTDADHEGNRDAEDQQDHERGDEQGHPSPRLNAKAGFVKQELQ